MFFLGIVFHYASSVAALEFYLPGVCTHTDTEGKQREARVQNILKFSEKNTIFNEHPVLNKFFVLCMKEYIDMQMRV